MPALPRLFAVAGFGLLAACAHKPVGTACDGVNRYALGVPLPPGAAEAAVSGDRTEPDFRSLLRSALVRRKAAATTEAPAAAPAGDLLFMSGGSQNGAFGAGILRAWQEAGTFPEFAVVTGVSTGALLGTFAFLRDGRGAAAEYTIADESQLLTPLGDGGTLSLVRHGARGDLAPLAKRLRDVILTDARLTAVADAGSGGRRFLVGVVDLDDGEAYIFDMTEIARQYRDAPSAAEKARFKGCYVAALMASASAPAAALPVFINNRIYVDGGARFGAFYVAAEDELKRANPPGTEETVFVAPQAFLIVNGTLQTARECPAGTLADARKRSPTAVASAEIDGHGERCATGPHKDWDIIGLALRSTDVLQNQGYRFSTQFIGAASSVDRSFRWLRIDDDWRTHMFDGLSCQDWQDRDRDPAKFGLLGKPPLQFQKRYMRCLIDYGGARAKAAGWLTP